MPAFGKLDAMPLDDIIATLNRVETIEATAVELKVSRRTVARRIIGRVERRFCWFPITTVDAKQIDAVATPVGGEE